MRITPRTLDISSKQGSDPEGDSKAGLEFKSLSDEEEAINSDNEDGLSGEEAGSVRDSYSVPTINVTSADVTQPNHDIVQIQTNPATSANPTHLDPTLNNDPPYTFISCKYCRSYRTSGNTRR